MTSDGIQWRVDSYLSRWLKVEDVEVVIEYFILLQVEVVFRQYQVIPNLDNIVVVINVAISKGVESRL